MDESFNGRARNSSAEPVCPMSMSTSSSVTVLTASATSFSDLPVQTVCFPVWPPAPLFSLPLLSTGFELAKAGGLPARFDALKLQTAPAVLQRIHLPLLEPPFWSSRRHLSFCPRQRSQAALLPWVLCRELEALIIPSPLGLDSINIEVIIVGIVCLVLLPGLR